MIHDSILGTIGNTPVVRVNRLAPPGITLYVKCEAFNPMSSVKDRLAIAMIEDAERRGTLIMRETGVINTTRGNPESGAVTAFQKIVDATGDLTGATGYFFVSGFSIDNHVVTKLTGRLCLP